MDLDLSGRCDVHVSRYNCPDALIDYSQGGYGLIVHDGGQSRIGINFCPWCGTRLAQEDRREYFKYSATLRIYGVIPDFNKISRALSLTPTYTHRRGERGRSTSIPYEHDMWAYTVPVDEASHLRDHIDALWREIRPKTDQILAFKRHATVDVFLGYRSNSDTAGVEVPAEALEMFTALQIPFGLSIIVC